MPVRKTSAITVLGALWLAGCGSPPPPAPPGPDADFGGWSWYAEDESKPGAADVGVSAAWGSWKTKFVYVILADIAITDVTAVGTADGRTRYDVVLKLPRDRKAEVRVETADGKTGSLTHAGRSYDLARGSVFVLRPKGEEFELTQLPRDVSGETAGVPGVVKLVRGDPELLRALAKSK